jgi:hypothetical protein
MTGNGRNKLRTYKLFKSEYGVENVTPLATYNLPLCVINWGPTHVAHDGCVGGISTNTKEKATRPQLNSINIFRLNSK